MHLRTGHINSQDFREILLTESLVHCLQHNSEEEQHKKEHGNSQNFVMDSLYNTNASESSLYVPTAVRHRLTMEGIQSSAEIIAIADSPTGDDGDDSDAQNRFWTQPKHISSKILMMTSIPLFLTTGRASTNNCS